MRLFSAVRFSARSVTWPFGAQVLHGEQHHGGRGGHRDRRGDAPHCNGGKSKAIRVAITRSEGDEALGHARGRERPVALHPRQVHAAAEVEEHEAQGDVHEDARVLDQRGHAQGRGERRDGESDEHIADHARQPQAARDLSSEHAGHQQHAEKQRVAEAGGKRGQETCIHDDWGCALLVFVPALSFKSGHPNCRRDPTRPISIMSPYGNGFLPERHRAGLRLRRHALAPADAGVHGASQDRRRPAEVLGDGEPRGARHRERPDAGLHAPHHRGPGAREGRREARGLREDGARDPVLSRRGGVVRANERVRAAQERGPGEAAALPHLGGPEGDPRGCVHPQALQADLRFRIPLQPPWRGDLSQAAGHRHAEDAVPLPHQQGPRVGDANRSTSTCPSRRGRSRSRTWSTWATG